MASRSDWSNDPVDLIYSIRSKRTTRNFSVTHPAEMPYVSSPFDRILGNYLVRVARYQQIPSYLSPIAASHSADSPRRRTKSTTNLSVSATVVKARANSAALFPMTIVSP
jgi:hypothetical protein